MQWSPILPTQPFQPQPYDTSPAGGGFVDPGYSDSAVVYLKLTVTGSDIYDPGCFIIGEGEAQLRWFAGDQQLRWLGYDANLRWDAVLRLGTNQC